MKKIYDIEEKCILGIKNHIVAIIYVGVTLLSIILRVSFFEFESDDFNMFLTEWYDEISEYGLKEQVGNYNMLYQFIIFIITKLPIRPIVGYKLVSIFFDYVLSFFVAVIIRDITKNNTSVLVAYTATLFLPTVFMNSALWGQVDASYCAFVIGSLYYISKKKRIMAFIFLGLAFCFKLQTIFILPFFIFIYLWHREYRMHLFDFLIIPLAMFIAGVPCYLSGRDDLLAAFRIYLEQTDSNHCISKNYPSFWMIIGNGDVMSAYWTMKNATILFTMILLLIIMYLIRNEKISNEKFYLIALVLTYSCTLFLPAMHERYGFLYEILGLIYCFIEIKTIPLFIGLEILSCATYGKYLFGTLWDMQALSIINVMIYMTYILVAMIYKRNIKSEE